MFVCIHVPNCPDAAGNALLECANVFSPRVENTAVGTIVFDAEGLARLFGSYAELAAKVAEQVRSIGLPSNIAVASNPDAAICAARGFAGITIVNRGTEAEQLHDLPVGVLSPSPEILETLERWGIPTLGAFAKLPAIQISERLGQKGVRLQKLARGSASRLLAPYREPLRFEEIVDLDYEIGTIEPLTFILSRMLDQLCSKLRKQNLATYQVHLKLGTFARVLRLPIPVRNPKLLMKLLILDLEAHPPNAPVRQVQVETIPAKPRVIQNGLFVPLSPEPEKLELTLARIAAVVGSENVGTAEVLDTHRPDAFRVHKFGVTGILSERLPAAFDASQAKSTVPLAKGDGRPAAGGRSHTILLSTREPPVSLALRLFRPPLIATVRLRNAIPHWIAFHGTHGPIETARGPWRTSGDWWRLNTWDREEWDIEISAPLHSQSLYRIYYDVHTGHWLVEGVYD